MRRRLQLSILRQLIRLQKWVDELSESTRQSLRVLSIILSGAQIRGVILLIAFILASGTSGYMIIEGWNFFDSLYMTIITVSTVGYGETRDLTAAGRVLTMVIILLALTVLGYGLTSSIEYVATGQLLTNVAEKQRTSMLKDMKRHFIIAGYGRVGQEVAGALRDEGVAFVVVDSVDEQVDRAISDGCLCVDGNATEDEILIEAGIERARGVICATGSDATNVYIALTARGINPDLFVISRASDESSEAKLLRAGADRVISPYILSGRRMANLAVRPYVVNFLDVTGSTGEIEKTLEEIVVEEGSIIENRTIGEAALGNRTGALILALYRATGELLTSPHPETLLEPGTRMIVLGTRDALDVTEALARNFQVMTDS